MVGHALFARQQQPADAVQRVVFVAAVANSLMLHAAADLVEHPRTRARQRGHAPAPSVHLVEAIDAVLRRLDGTATAVAV